MALIGSLIIGMSATTSKLQKDFKSAGKAVDKFVGKFANAKSALVGFAGAVGVGLAANALKDLVVAQIDSIDAAADLASQLGTTTGNLQALQFAVSLNGSDTETLNAALQKMNLNLADAASGAGPAADALAQIGLSANDLAQMDAVEAFDNITGALQSIQNPAQQAALTADIFGKSAGSLINVINAGPAAMEAMREKAGQLGLVLSDVDVNNVAAAKDSLDLVGFALQGVGNKVLVELVPYIVAASTAITDFASSGVDAGELASTAISWVIEGTAFAIDTVYLFSKAWNVLAGSVQAQASVITKVLAWIAQGIEKITELFGNTSHATSEYLHGLSDSYAKSATENFKEVGKVFDEQLPGDKFKTFADGIKTNADKAAKAIQGMGEKNRTVATTVKDLSKEIGDLNKSLELQISNFGKSSNQAAINKLRMEGASESQLGQAKYLAKQLQAKEKEASLKDKANEYIKAAKTPAQILNQTALELKELSAKGLISDATLKDASKKAKDDYLEATKVEKKDSDLGPRLASALEFGSNEARSQILNHRYGNGNDPVKKLGETSKAQLAEIQKTNVILAKNKAVDFLIAAF